MIELTDQPFDPGLELNRFREGRAETGAVVSFIGMVRGKGGHGVELEIEAYPGFTESEITRVAEAATVRFDLHDLAITHRVGRIALGEPIVLVLTAAAHRRDAFEACDFLMDYLKSRAPLWKKEHGPDGSLWAEPTARDQADLSRWTSPSALREMGFRAGEREPESAFPSAQGDPETAEGAPRQRAPEWLDSEIDRSRR